MLREGRERGENKECPGREKTSTDAFHLNSTGLFGTHIYFLTKFKYVAL